jgi:hypothetical protein
MARPSTLRLLIATGCLVLVVSDPCLARPQVLAELPAEPPAGPADSTATTKKELDLGLALAPGGAPQAFTLFGPDARGEGGLDMDRMLLALDGRRFAGPPVLIGLRTRPLGLSLGTELDEQGKRRLRLGPLTRGWDDLDPYEKFSVVLHYAAGLAGAAYMIDRLLD